MRRRPSKRSPVASEAAAVKTPRTFDEWRKEPGDREYDAANAFGHFLIRHCRDEVIEKHARGSPRTRAAVEAAVDDALHNVVDMLEGFWPLEVGPKHSMELALHVRVRSRETGELVDSQEISPCKLDLPIGYWKWARERTFR